MQNLYIVTHAQSIHHIEHLGGGWYDTPLTEKGTRQAKELGKGLFKTIGISQIPIYTSDLKRAVETASLIATVFQSPVTPDPRLRELNIGEAGGKPADWQEANSNPLLSDSGRLDHRMFPGGESRRELGLRISECLNEIVTTGEANVIVVSHGHALTFIIMAWLKVPVDHMDYCRFRTAPATVTHLQQNDRDRERTVVYISKSFES